MVALMKDASFVHRAADGTPIHVHGFLPDERVHAVLQIAHGMAEHGARYARLAAAFTGAGFAVYAHDHRGHGKSVPRGHAPGHVADARCFDVMLADTHAVNRDVAKRHPGLPIVFLGHSMGSFVAQALLFTHPKDVVACALSGSNGRPGPLARAGRAVARVERLRLGPLGHSPLIRALSFDEFNKAFEPNRTRSDWLSRDPAEVDRYEADPLCGFDCDVQLWMDFLDALDASVHRRSNQERVPRDMPIYLFAGDRDPVGEFGAGVRRLYDEYRRVGIRDLTIKLYPGARHETLNETNREQVTNDMLAFAKRAVASA